MTGTQKAKQAMKTKNSNKCEFRSAARGGF